MIDEVRNLVMAVLNKNNFGYMTPAEFNLYARQAQMEVFTSYFSKYNTYVYNENLRTAGSDYADQKFRIESELERFLVSTDPVLSNGVFPLPSDMYRLEVVNCYDILLNQPTVREFAAVAEKVQPQKINVLASSNVTQPTKVFPMYTQVGSTLRVYPSLYMVNERVELVYIRLPIDPVWGYTVVNSIPMYNAGTSTDFELGDDEFGALVVKILKYAGIPIREADVYKFAKTEEQGLTQEE